MAYTVKPLFWETAQGHKWQPKAKPKNGKGADKKVFQCLCGQMTAWHKESDESFRLIRVEKRSVHTSRKGRSFYEFKYDTSVDHSSYCLNKDDVRGDLVWVKDTRGYFKIALLPHDSVPDEDGLVQVLLERSNNPTTVPLTSIYK